MHSICCAAADQPEGTAVLPALHHLQHPCRHPVTSAVPPPFVDLQTFTGALRELLLVQTISTPPASPPTTPTGPHIGAQEHQSQGCHGPGGLAHSSDSCPRLSTVRRRWPHLQLADGQALVPLLLLCCQAQLLGAIKLLLKVFCHPQHLLDRSILPCRSAFMPHDLQPLMTPRSRNMAAWSRMCRFCINCNLSPSCTSSLLDLLVRSRGREGSAVSLMLPLLLRAPELQASRSAALS